MDIISQQWAWYISGPLIGLTMFSLIYLGKTFGVSSTLRTICAASGAGKYVEFFDFDWRDQVWNILFVIGAVIGGGLAAAYLKSPVPMSVAPMTIMDLSELGFITVDGLAPDKLFGLAALSSGKTWILLIVGGILIGFGTRWAGGCTSGHAITGMSNLQLPSLIAVIGFFIGGLVMTNLLFPLIFSA